MDNKPKANNHPNPICPINERHAKGLTAYEQYVDKNWRFIWLIYTLFFFFPLFFIPFTPMDIVKNILLYAVFISLTLACGYFRYGIAVAIAGCIIVLATFTAGINPGSNVFFGYAIFFTSFYLERKFALLALLCSGGCILLSATIFNLMQPFYLIPGVVTVIGCFAFGTIHRQAIIHAQKEYKSQQQLEQIAKVAERERIARDLHDVLGHTLSSISLKAQLAEKLGNINDIDGALKEIREVAQISSKALFDVRQAITGYKVKTLDQQFDALLGRLQDKGVEAEVNCDFSKLGAKAEAALVLILTEAITNILRHSNATRVRIFTQLIGNQFKVTLWDNGIVKNIVNGNGLNGIAERLDELNGGLAISIEHGMSMEMTIGREFLL